MRICTEHFLKFMSKTKLLHQNFLLIFQKSLNSNIFLDPKEGVNPPLSLHAHVCTYLITYLDTCSLTYLLTFLLTYLPTYLPNTFLHTYLLTQLITYLLTY